MSVSSSTTYEQTRWSLADLFPTGSQEELESAFGTLRQQVQAFAETTRPQLTAGIRQEDFIQIIHGLEKLTRQGYALFGFASLSFAADTQSQEAQTLMARVQQFMAEMENQTLFFSLWWKGLEDDQAAPLAETAGDFRYWLEAMRYFKKHTLSEPEEKIINIKDVTGTSALTRLYDSITNRYTYHVTVNGEAKEVTRGELMVYVRTSDPELRAQAYQELYRVYGNDGPILGQIYQTRVRDWHNENINLRGFKSPMAVRNLVNDIPDEVVDTLLETSQKNAGIFQRYFQLKARWLGLEILRRYDIYAPVVTSDKEFPFDQAAHLVLDSFREFDPEIADMAQRVFDSQHLDSQVRKGKRSGAFCSTVSPKLTPWVLLNYQGRSDDVETMAHELGHAIHSMLASEHSIFTAFPSLPLAETASTFGEMLLVDRMLREEPDETVRRDILFRQMDGNYATIMRQSFFALFERQAHEMIQQNASVDELAKAYQENLRTQFGSAVDVSDEFKWEWVSIPHIYQVPFYVYAYSFGQLLVLALYEQYKQEGEAFKPRYRKILATGGSNAPVRVLAEAGIDIHDANFWQGGFNVLERLVTQLEAIPVK